MNKLTFEKILLTYVILTIISISMKHEKFEIAFLNIIGFLATYFLTKDNSMNKFDLKSIRNSMYIELTYPIICILNSLTKTYGLTIIRNPIAYLIYLIIFVLLGNIFYFNLKSYKWRNSIGK